MSTASTRSYNYVFAAAVACASLGALTGCNQEETVTFVHPCVPALKSTGLGSTGTGYVFSPDPMSESGNTLLSATSTLLDNYRETVTLDRLDGTGVLNGSYVSVRDGLGCKEDYGVYSALHEFKYSQRESGFQQTNSYYAGDRYRAGLAAAGELIPSSPVKIVANCMDEDNAYYVRLINTGTGAISGKVCLGNSQTTADAYYADDAQVVTHELQHATTVDAYSLAQYLNNLWYEEAGGLNEGISDFVAIMQYEPETNAAFDARVFSRWALGKFSSGSPSTRGAHRCPTYDPSYPNCASYALGSAGMDSSANRVSYAYPDGMGWPYTGNFSGAGYLKSVHNSSVNRFLREEIHNAAPLITGALWDIYQALKSRRSGDASAAKTAALKLVMETIKILPKPSSSDVSPVSYISFSQAMRTVAALLTSTFTANDLNDLDSVLTARGLYGYTPLPSNWASVGPGNSPTTPGLRVIDNPSTLMNWIASMQSDTGVVTQSGATASNGKLNKGEVVALWVDIQNTAAASAGGVKIDVTSPDSDIRFLDWNYNFGYIASNHVQLVYQKVYGTDAATALNLGSGTYATGAGSTYFTTNPQYASTYYTAIWVKAASSANSNKVVNLQVIVTPTNGSATTLSVPVTIY